MAGAARANTIVQFNFSGGITDSSGQYIDYVQVGLFDSQAPQTVANFLSYVTNNVYDDTIIHRAVSDFIVQGGGYTPVSDSTGNVTALNPLASYGPIPNEFSPSRPNVAGTIAMAKLGGDPNSATNQWFFNVADNSSNLDNQNGGFTVFGQVLGEGMQLIDAIDGLPTYNLNQYFDPNYAIDGADGGPFTDVPIYNNSSFIVVTSVAVVSGSSSPSTWAAAVSGSWSNAGNWSNGAVPAGIAAGAVINASTTAALTVTLDSPQTVGSLVLGNSASGTVGYTLSGTGSNTLAMDNAGSGATIAVTDGTHAINAPVILVDNLVVTSGGTHGWTLSFGTASSITDNGEAFSLTMSGSGGMLIISGSDSYSGGTFVTAGTLEVTNPGALPDETSLTIGASGVFIFDPMAVAALATTSPGLAVVPVPEPTTLALVIAGVVGLVGYRLMRRKKPLFACMSYVLALFVAGCNPAGRSEKPDPSAKESTATSATDGNRATTARTAATTAESASRTSSAFSAAPPAIPANLANACEFVQALDWNKLAPPAGATITEQSPTHLHVTMPLAVPAAVNLYLAKLDALGWKPTDPKTAENITESFAQLSVGKDGYLLMLTAMPGEGKETGLEIHHVGNLDTRSLPRVAGAEDQYSSQFSSLYFTNAKVDETAVSLRRLLKADGWQEYDRAFTQKADRADACDLLFRRKAYNLHVSVSKPATQPTKSAVQYIVTTLARRLAGTCRCPAYRDRRLAVDPDVRGSARPGGHGQLLSYGDAGNRLPGPAARDCRGKVIDALLRIGESRPGPR